MIYLYFISLLLIIFLSFYIFSIRKNCPKSIKGIVTIATIMIILRMATLMLTFIKKSISYMVYFKYTYYLNFIYIPIYYQITPLVFLLGIVLMSFLMSFVYLWFRKSSVWLYGIWFCIFYELILIWQMPIACVTFWKSTWGTRDTKEDLEAKAKKEKRKSKTTKVSASINE